MLGHIGLNVTDLTVAKKYYDALMPALGFTEYFNAADEFWYCPSGAKPGTYIFFYPASDPGHYRVRRTGFATAVSSESGGTWTPIGWRMWLNIL